MGRSRGGLTTKIYALVDANGMPVALKLTEGQAHDGVSAADMLAGLSEGQILLADRAYDSDRLRQTLAERGAWANVKPMTTRKHTLPSVRGSIASATPTCARNPAWAVRELEAVSEEAARNGLVLDDVVEMPANNLSVIFRR